jgi:hypothetical protein
VQISSRPATCQTMAVAAVMAITNGRFQISPNENPLEGNGPGCEKGRSVATDAFAIRDTEKTTCGSDAKVSTISGK